MRQHFPAWNDIVATILKASHQIENRTTPSFDVYLLEKQSCQISSWSDTPIWNDGQSPQQEEQQQVTT